MLDWEDVNSNNELNATPLEYQVAGHSFVPNKCLGLMSVKGGFVLKPILQPYLGQREIEFYESWKKESKTLQTFVPRFFGTVQHKVNNQLGTWIVLEDICRGYAQPCVMDIKIGRQTWDPFATEEKKQKEMRKLMPCRKDLAFCIPGYQVYDATTHELHRPSRDYAKSLDSDGVRKALRQFLNGHAGFSRTMLIQILTKLWQLLSWFRTQTSYHFFSSSLLLAYDAAKLREDLKNNIKKNINGTQKPTVARQLSLRIPSGPLTPGFEQKRRSPVFDRSRPSTPSSTSSHSPSAEDLQDSFDSMCKTHSMENNYEKDISTIRENYSVVLKDLLHDPHVVDSWVTVKMIDFAHVFPANSIDENYLEGLENLTKIFELFFMESESSPCCS